MENSRPERLTLANIISNFFRDLTSADRGLWGTVVQLTLRPERVVNTYLFEDRKRFIRPTRYVLFVFSLLALNYVALQYRHGKPLHEFLRPYMEQQVDDQIVEIKSQVMKQTNSGNPEANAVLDEKFYPVYREGVLNYLSFSVRYSNYIGVVAVPFMALLYLFCFPRLNFNYPEHLAASGYMFAHSGLLSMLGLPVLLIFTTPATLFYALSVASVLQAVYLLYATIRIYVNKATDFLLALLLYFLVVVTISVMLYKFSYFIGALYGERIAGGAGIHFRFGMLLYLMAPILFLVGTLWLRNRRHHWPWALGCLVLATVFAFIW